MGDITMIEADWRSCLTRTIFYFPLNAVGFIFTGNGVYGEDYNKNFWKNYLMW